MSYAALYLVDWFSSIFVKYLNLVTGIKWRKQLQLIKAHYVVNKLFTYP